MGYRLHMSYQSKSQTFHEAHGSLVLRMHSYRTQYIYSIPVVKQFRRDAKFQN